MADPMNTKDIATLLEQVVALPVQAGTAIMEVYEGALRSPAYGPGGLSAILSIVVKNQSTMLSFRY
jgi:hypothetical protein